MLHAPRRVLIVGAGIGGLAAARALRALGAEVELVEQAPAFAPLGAGIVLGANAVAVLSALGVEVGPHGRSLAGIEIRGAGGRVLQGVSIAAPARAMVALHRAELHELLLDGVAGAPLRHGASVAALAEDERGVVARLTDGSEARWDLVVGADGMRSRVRELLLGDAAPPLARSGLTCWRLVVPDPGLAGAVEVWERGPRLGAVPLGRGRMYVYVVARGAGALEPVLARFEAQPPPVPEVLRAVRAAETVTLVHELTEVSRLEWGRDRVWLLGDAAHAMMPDLGQGAAMALEDAAALALEWSRDPDPRRAFARYRRRRHARARSVWRRSRLLGRAAHWRHPLARLARDTTLRLTPAAFAARQLEALYAPGLALARELSVAMTLVRGST